MLNNNNNNNYLYLKDVKCFCSIGVTDAERVLGQELVFNVKAHFDMNKAATSDEYSDTLCYLQLYNSIIRITASKEYKLLEHLAYSLCDDIMKEFSQITRLELSIAKTYIPAANYHGEIILHYEKNRDNL